jgi:deazaflavin-dependent oxidoreductase (nitroreductase family)
LSGYEAERKRNPFVRSGGGGRALSAMQLPLFAVRPPRGYGILTTTGRKTGKKRRRCIRAIRDGEKAYIVAIKGARTGWQKNLRANPNVRLRLPGGSHDGIARELRGTADEQRARQVYCETVNRFDYPAFTLWRTGRPTPAKIREMHRAWFDQGIPFVVQLNPPRR